MSQNTCICDLLPCICDKFMDFFVSLSCFPSRKTGRGGVMVSSVPTLEIWQQISAELELARHGIRKGSLNRTLGDRQELSEVEPTAPGSKWPRLASTGRDKLG